MRSAVDEGRHLALFLIDLERFKNINDTLGQSAGNALLQQVAEWLTEYVSGADRVARIGSDQFAVGLRTDTSSGDVLRQLEAMMDAFVNHPCWTAIHTGSQPSLGWQFFRTTALNPPCCSSTPRRH